MDEGEIEIRVPFSDGQFIEYATIVVKTWPGMTYDEFLREAFDAINEFVLERQSGSDRLNGMEPVTNDLGEYLFDIEGFTAGEGFEGF